MDDLRKADAPTVSRTRLAGISAVLLALAAAHFARPVLLPLVAGLLFAALSWPAYHWLKARIPRGLALLATVLLLTLTILAMFAAVGWGLASVVTRLREQPERLEALQQRLNAATRPLGVTIPDLGLVGDSAVAGGSGSRSSEPAGPRRGSGADSVLGAGSGAASDSASVGGTNRGAVARRLGFGIYSMFGYFALAVGFAALTLAELPVTREKMLLRFGAGQGGRVLAIGAELAQSMRRYMKVKTITSVIAGVSTGLLSLVFGIEFAALWAFLAFLFEYVPTIGSVLAVVPPVAYALVQFDTLARPLAALGVLTLAQLFLGNYVDPRIEGRLLSLSPVVVLLSIVFWAWMWGAPGSLLGVPIVVAVTVVARHFESSRWIWAILTEPNADERGGGQRGGSVKPGVSR